MKLNLQEKLGDNFTVGEMVSSATARRYSINNLKMIEEQLECLRDLVQNVLQPARERLGKPIIVTSGFRCAQLNIAVGGVPTSQHRLGQAADVVTKRRSDMPRLLQIMKTLPYDQLLHEVRVDSIGRRRSEWIHVSYKRTGRRHEFKEITLQNE